MGAVARGALRPGSRLGPVLLPLIPLDVAFSGRSELLTLKTAEATGVAPELDGPRTYSLFYVNELILRLTATHDPNGSLFEAYRSTVAGLGRNEPLEALLRRFEKRLLDALGLGLSLATEAATGEPIALDGQYRYVPERGALAGSDDKAAPRVSGATLLALRSDGELADEALIEAKQLMRYVLNHHLEGRPLSSRKLFEARRDRSS